MTIVACVKGHPSEFMFKPFSSPRWAKNEGNFPVIELEKPVTLSGLAKFLADNIPSTHRRRSTIVTCYAAEGTERAAIREKYHAKPQYAENVIKCYNVSETERAVINDWDFALLHAGTDAVSYWEIQADLMIKAGVEIVKIRSSISAVAVEYKI